MKKYIFICESAKPIGEVYIAFESLEDLQRTMGSDTRYYRAELIQEAKTQPKTLFDYPEVATIDSCVMVKIKDLSVIPALKSAYPNVDICKCIKEMDAWAIANKKKYRDFAKTLRRWVENVSNYSNRRNINGSNYSKSGICGGSNNFSDVKISNE